MKMNRYFKIGIVAILAVMLSASIGYCGFNNWGNTDTNRLLGRELPYDAIYVGAQRGGTSTMVSGSLAIPISYAVVIKAITQETTPCTLEDGYAGQILTFQISTLTGTATLTPDTCTGFTTITFDAAREYATLLYIDDTIGWICIATNATTA